MLNRNKVQNSINSAYFDQISQIEVKNVQLDFQVDRLFSEYQMQPKKTKLKATPLNKNKTQQKKTSQSSISTKERSKNQEDSSNVENQGDTRVKQSNVKSLKKNISKKVFFVDNEEKHKITQTTVKKTARKITVYSQFERTGETQKKFMKSPEPMRVERKVSKVKGVQQRYKVIVQNKKSQQDKKQQNPIKRSRQSCESNKNMNLVKKSRSQSIMSASRQRLSSKNHMEPKTDKLKEQNRKIIMRDYFGEDEQETNKNKNKPNALNTRNKRSSSKSTKDIALSRQRVESKSKQLNTIKSRERVGSMSKERVLVFSSNNIFS